MILHAELRIAIALMAVALGIYGGGLYLHTGDLFTQSQFPYFTYYAKALLDGHLYFTQMPPPTADLSVFEGRVYMHFPPFPAILLMPWVQLFGVGFPDRVVSVGVGALNGGLFYLLLGQLNRKRLLPAPESLRIALSFFFIFGTVHFYLSVTSNPWETAHVICNALVILALLSALNRRYVLAAGLYVAILFTRSHIILTFPVVIGLFFWQERREGEIPVLFRRLIPALVVLLAGVILLLVFNYQRFGDAFQNGITYSAMHPIFQQKYRQYGYFDLAYLPRNLKALLLLPPVSHSAFPYFTFSYEGLSVFLASPLYLYLFCSLRRRFRKLSLPLWGVVAAALIPVLLLMGTGEAQFGHRYSSDLQVFLILLTMIGMDCRLGRLSIALLTLSIAMNAYGAAWFVSQYAQ